jgi:hypothetical protein
MSTQGVPVTTLIAVGGDASLRGALDGCRSLCADDFIARAHQEDGRTLFRKSSFVEPVRRLVCSLTKEAQVSLFGVRAARFAIEQNRPAA